MAVRVDFTATGNLPQFQEKMVADSKEVNRYHKQTNAELNKLERQAQKFGESSTSAAERYAKQLVGLNELLQRNRITQKEATAAQGQFAKEVRAASPEGKASEEFAERRAKAARFAAAIKTHASKTAVDAIFAHERNAISKKKKLEMVAAKKKAIDNRKVVDAIIKHEREALQRKSSREEAELRRSTGAKILASRKAISAIMKHERGVVKIREEQNSRLKTANARLMKARVASKQVSKNIGGMGRGLAGSLTKVGLLILAQRELNQAVQHELDIRNKAMETGREKEIGFGKLKQLVGTGYTEAEKKQMAREAALAGVKGGIEGASEFIFTALSAGAAGEREVFQELEGAKLIDSAKEFLGDARKLQSGFQEQDLSLTDIANLVTAQAAQSLETAGDIMKAATFIGTLTGQLGFDSAEMIAAITVASRDVKNPEIAGTRMQGILKELLQLKDKKSRDFQDPEGRKAFKLVQEQGGFVPGEFLETMKNVEAAGLTDRQLNALFPDIRGLVGAMSTVRKLFTDIGQEGVVGVAELGSKENRAGIVQGILDTAKDDPENRIPRLGRMSEMELELKRSDVLGPLKELRQTAINKIMTAVVDKGPVARWMADRVIQDRSDVEATVLGQERATMRLIEGIGAKILGTELLTQIRDQIERTGKMTDRRLEILTEKISIAQEHEAEVAPAAPILAGPEP